MVRRWRLTLLSIGMLAITCVAGSALEVVNFAVDPQTPIVGQTVTFTENTSEFEPGYIDEFVWDFGDGPTVSVDSGTHFVEHTFLQAGEYRVTLTVKDARGGETTSDPKTILVSVPTADFSYEPSNPTTQDSVYFTGIATPSQGVDQDGWNWDFGDNSSGSTGQNPIHVFTEKGTYQVSLVVTYKTGYSAVKTRQITVLNSPPVADFSHSPAEPQVGERVTFTADGSSDPDGSIASYAWDFESDGVIDIQGGPGSARTVVHMFSRDGNYNVTLMVTDNEGDSAWRSHPIPVNWNVPVADFTIDPSDPEVGEAVTFDASSSTDADGDSTIVTYEWDFDGDGRIDGNGKTINHAFDDPGTANVILTVTDDTGLKGKKSVFLNIVSIPPTAEFTFSPTNPNTGQVISFDASDSDDDGEIILYKWNFGDGSPVATGLKVTHSYAAPGVYPVTLTVTDNHTAFDVVTQGVPVEMGGTGGVNQPPLADFSFEPAKGPDVNLNEVVTFKATKCSDKDGSIDSYEWDFNNDGIYDATGKTVTHIFHRGGGQIVTLQVMDNEGAPGFKTKVVPVKFVAPTASFSYSPEKPRVGDVVSFDAKASSDADGRVDFYEWDFDNDGIIDATGMSVTHAFESGGSIPVMLKVTDDDGVTNSTTKAVTVSINNAPVAEFSISPTSPTTADKISFQDKSTDADGSVVSWEWDFGDGSTSSVQSPSHKYESADTYSVTLKVKDNEGAIGSVTQRITVLVPSNVPPVASFTFSPSLPQVGSPVAFTDTSTDSDGTVSSWSWDFGDGDTSQVRNPSHTYSATGTYTVSLTVTDNDGARSDVKKKQVQVAVAGAEVGVYSYPNPASREATIVYYLPAGATEPVLRIYSITGALIFEQELAVEEPSYVWALNSTGGTAQPNGLYLCIVTAQNDEGRTIKSPIFKLLIAR